MNWYSNIKHSVHAASSYTNYKIRDHVFGMNAFGGFFVVVCDFWLETYFMIF